MYVYVIEQVGTGVAKIGISANPNRRMNELQTSNPHKLVMRYLIKCQPDTAQHIEAELHRRFSEYRIQGEWFHVDVAKIKAVVDGRWDVIGIAENSFAYHPGLVQYKVPNDNRYIAFSVIFAAVLILSAVVVYGAMIGEIELYPGEAIGYIVILLSSMAGLAHSAIVWWLLPSKDSVRGKRYHKAVIEELRPEIIRDYWTRTDND